jgi:hypothetical protein
MIAKNEKPWILLMTGLAVMMLTSLAPCQTQTPAQKYEGLLGTWEVQAEGVSYSIIFEFFLEDGVLKGKYTGSAGTTQMDNLTFEKNLVRFSVTVSTMALDYSAVIDGDKLSGQVSLEYGQAEITGKKVRSGGA